MPVDSGSIDHVVSDLDNNLVASVGLNQGPREHAYKKSEMKIEYLNLAEIYLRLQHCLAGATLTIHEQHRTVKAIRRDCLLGNGPIVITGGRGLCDCKVLAEKEL